MPDLTPQEIQEARTIARNVIGRDFQRSLRVHVLARAVLALTEQVEKLDDEVLKWTAIAGGHAEQIEALTEQQPEPVKRYRIDGPYTNGWELVDTADTVLGTYAHRRMAEVERDRLERKHREQQSELEADRG